MAKAESFLVAVDDGYAQTKVYGQSLDGGAPRREVFRTSVRSGRHAIRGMQDEGALGLYRTEEGEHYTVNDAVTSENTTFDGFHLSTMNRAVVHHGLIQAGYEGRDIDLVTGLPVHDYFTPGDGVNVEKIEAKKSNLMRGVERSQGGETARVRSVDVFCQAVAAFFDHAFDDNLGIRDDLKGRVGVIDIGGRTTDIAVVVNGAGLDEQNSGSANFGALDVYRALNDAICQEHKLREAFPLNDLSDAVRTGQLLLWGERMDVSGLVTDSIRQVEGNIAREIERRLGNVMAGLRRVIFVGGGSALFKDIPGRFRSGHMGEDPEFANARGFYKYAALRARRAGKAA